MRVREKGREEEREKEKGESMPHKHREDKG
jgi:hypothetical protein